MARIAGVDLPRNKRMEIALTYVYGIGRSAALKICAEAQIDPGRKSDDLTDEEGARIRRVLDATYKVEGEGGGGRGARGGGEQQAPRRPGLLPGNPPPPQPAGSGPADPYQRAHPQGPAARHPGEEAAAAEGLRPRLRSDHGKGTREPR